ncbi:hypothetical protein JCM5353_001926 [Sporobolomyces roseus]
MKATALPTRDSQGQDSHVEAERLKGNEEVVDAGREENEEERELRKAMLEAMRDYHSAESHDIAMEDKEIEEVRAVEEFEGGEEDASESVPIPEISSSNSESSSDSNELASPLLAAPSPPTPSSPLNSGPTSIATTPTDQADEETRLTSQNSDSLPSETPLSRPSASGPNLPTYNHCKTPSISPSPSQDHEMSTLFRRSQSLSTSLSRLSRRATVCLSTFYSTTLPSVSKDLDEEEKEVLVERVLEDERKGVEEDLERFVESVKKDSDYKDFSDVKWTVEKGTSAEDFCLACEGLVRLAEHLAPGLAGLCTSDIVGELKKIRTRIQVEGVETLEQIIALERGQRRKIATDAVNWLLLMLKFGSTAYQYNLKSTKEELSTSFTRAWDEEYWKYFNFLVRPLFKIVIKACPSRQTFYSKLGSPLEVVEKDFGAWLDGVDVVAERIEKWEKESKEGSKGKKGK